MLKSIAFSAIIFIIKIVKEETIMPDYIIKNEFNEKVGGIKIIGNLTKDKLVSLWLYHEFIGNMYFEEAEYKCNDLCLFIEEVKR